MEIWKTIKKAVRKKVGLDMDYRVEVDCAGKEFLGTEYGGWCICPEKIAPGGVLYSLGVGEDISFDLAMIERYKVSVFAFDPTPRSIGWVKGQALPENFRFYDFGITSYDGAAMFYPHPNPKHVSHTVLTRRKQGGSGIEVQFRRLKTVMDMLGHNRIDILKMDIEGAEYEVLDDLLSSGIEIGQLLVEFHHEKRFREAGILRTKKCIAELQKRGFRIFYVSKSQEEFSFIKGPATDDR